MNTKEVVTVMMALLSILTATMSAIARERWSEEQANAWCDKQPWLVGCNFTPSTAINQLEMWQADTFDVTTIDRELGWAEAIGFNSVRVFLHNLLWEQDRDGFIKRMEKFLDIADKHNIGVMFVLLDGVWDPQPKLGKQRDPKPHVHNSGWVQSPGREILSDPTRHDELKPYIVGVISHFEDDPRIQVWDIFNEGDNPNVNSYGPKGANTELKNKAAMARMLMQKLFVWAREADPSQPITAGVWRSDWTKEKAGPFNRLLLNESDVISFHSYGPIGRVKQRVAVLREYNRPLLCTEYMTRATGSTFDPIMGYLKQQKVAAYNWGFVAGKTQTQYPWETWQKQYTAEPELWFHEIFRADGTPYIRDEVDYIKRVTGKTPSEK